MAKIVTDDKIKTFQGLGALLNKTAKQSAENNIKKPTYVPSKKSGKNKKLAASKSSTTKVIELVEAPLDVRPLSKEESDQVESMSEKNTYPEISEVVTSGNLDKALKMIDAALKGKQNSLQLMTARNIVVNCMKEDVLRQTKSMLLVNVKHLLLNTEAGHKEVEEVQQFQNFENGETIEQQEKNREFFAISGAIGGCIDRGELREAAIAIGDALKMSLTRETREIFRSMFKSLKSYFKNEISEGLGEDRELKADMIGRMRDSLGKATLEALSWDEKEELRIQETRIDVDLPIDVSRITIVEDIPLLLDLEGALTASEIDSLKLTRIANTTFLSRCRLIGVPTAADSKDSGFEGEFKKAKAYIWRKEGILLQHIPLRRPDSDATWFPIVPVEAVINNVAFPDRVRTSSNDQISVEERRRRVVASTLQIRARREAFESVEKELVVGVDKGEDRLSELRVLIKATGEKLKDKFEVSSPKMESIQIYYRRLLTEELVGKIDFVERLTIRKRINKERDYYLDILDKKISYQMESKVLRATLEVNKDSLLVKRKAILHPRVASAMAAVEAVLS